MERELEDIVNECKEFIRLKKMHKQSRYPDAGQPAYLISSNWLELYKKYILHREIKAISKPHMEPEHCKKNHPGPITNDNDFCDPSIYNLKGTGKLEQFEVSVVDKYLKTATA